MPSLNNKFNEHTAFRNLAKGSEEAFELIYNYYSPRIFSFIDRMLHLPDLTEELVQDIFINLWQRRDHLEQLTNPSAYLYQMASNKVLDYQRSIARRRPILDYVIAQQNVSSIDTEERIIYKETLLLLTEAIDMLPAQRREIFKLSRHEGLSHNEIAEKLGLSKSTVANQIVAALKHIRIHLEKNSDMFSFAIFFILTK
ncbi:RNA polymerase sigma-70 factor [Sphingobacterium oryzagri]|uniref:RNA polymerase sigma-70 factor n=1 Tax=Sphingobacterium oryzagri TaxID=3025669 RepID=A0ABY7WC68_9SPHI|nr:RNA polymerase sigma-70 factor [Sphingobacterium sp. KACC 22765]WDF67067.1 RNA polymerase sigma-70 factor [Sphingobacterium sp. KACC 22765]